MKRLLLFGLLLLGFNAIGQIPTQRTFHATEKLITDNQLFYQSKDIPLLDVAYTQYSVDSTSWHKTYTFADKYIRVSNDTKTTWMIMKILKTGIQRSDSLVVFATPKSVRDAVGAISINTDSLVHKRRTETITGAKTFTQNITTNKAFIGQRAVLAKDTTGYTLEVSNATGIGTYSSSPYVGILGEGTASNSYGVVGFAPFIPFQGANTQTITTGIKHVYTLRGNSEHMTVQNDYGLGVSWYMPIAWTDPSVTEVFSAQMAAVWTDVTLDHESARFEWRLMRDGTLTKVMDLSDKGNLTLNNITLNSISAPTDSIGGQIYYGSDGIVRYFNSVTNTWQTMAGEPNLARVYSLTLPSASTVADRCSGAVSGTDYPAGWTIGAYSGNTHDLQITHGLNRRIVSVTVFSTSGAGDRILINTAAYSGMLAPDKNTLRLEGLATVLTPIVVNITFN